MKQWLSNISRQTNDGKPWEPTHNDKVCSEHFLPSDFNFGFGYKVLQKTAVPTVFPGYPAHKQCQPLPERPPPKERLPILVQGDDEGDLSSGLGAGIAPETHIKRIKLEHSYICASVEADLTKTKLKLVEMQKRLAARAKEVKALTAKLKRRDNPCLSWCLEPLMSSRRVRCKQFESYHWE